MRKIVRNPEPFNTTPLWQAYRVRCRHALPRPARRLADAFGLEPELARIIAELAGLKGGGHDR